MKRFILVTAAAVFLSGCLKTKDDVRDCSFDECSVKAPASEIDSVKAYLEQNNITATQHCSGLFYAIDSMGSGPAPTVCSYVAFRYKGMLKSGTVFDKSETTTQYIPLGQLVQGWINGLPKIKQGGGMRLYIPPTLGYGIEDVKDRNGNVVIPGNSMLIFEVKLDGVINR